MQYCHICNYMSFVIPLPLISFSKGEAYVKGANNIPVAGISGR